MKTNIILVGFDLTFVSKFANKLAEALGYRYINTEMNFDSKLLKNIDLPLVQDEPLAEAKERALLTLIASKDKVVASVPVDMFISNNNYKLFNNSYRILITNDNLTNDLTEFNLDKNIENFIKKRVDLVLKQEDLRIDEIIEKFKG